jgi:opacity protein-like surface antigen
MKQTLTLAALIGLSSLAQAGTVAPAPAPVCDKCPVLDVPKVCECFEAGEINLGFYGASILFDESSAGYHGDHGYDDAAGGGVSVSYFATRNLGFAVDGTWLATGGTLHSVTGSVIYRLPISCRIAPYAFGGGGVRTNGETQGTLHAGAGVEFCISSNISLFADGRYTWTENENDHTLLRGGLSISL